MNAGGPDARAVAGRVLDRVRERDSYANLVLPPALTEAGLTGRDAALATELVYGTLRMRGTLDWVLSLYADRSLDRIEPEVLERLRLGAYQLLYLDVPAHAAVGETVGTVEARARGFANAILRKIASGKDAIPWPTKDGDLEAYLRIRYAHPVWMIRRWLECFGPHDTEALCAANNTFPGIGVRVNTARTTPQDLKQRFEAAGLRVEAGRWSLEAMVVRGGGAPTSWPGWADGHFAVQDESSVLVAEAMDAPSEALVVDLCAGPGGKTGHLASLSRRVVAVELHGPRARMVRDTLRRLGLEGHLVRADGRAPPIRPGTADAVLIDAPCSGLGVLRRRPEARWRIDERGLGGLADLQLDLLRGGCELLRGGGTLVYAVCTVRTEETVGVIERFLASTPEVELVDVLSGVPRPGETPYVQLLPHVHHTDGMFVAKLSRRSG